MLTNINVDSNNYSVEISSIPYVEEVVNIVNLVLIMKTHHIHYLVNEYVLHEVI